MTQDDAETLAAEQATEYGTYVAKETIYYDGARAFNVGDPVPVSHVKEHGYDALVEKVSKPKAIKADSEKG